MNTLLCKGIEHLSTNFNFDFVVLNVSSITSRNYKIVPMVIKVE